MSAVAIEQLPQRERRAVLTESINLDARGGVSGEGLERLLSVRAGGRAVGRARVYHTSYPGLDVLAAVLAGLRRL